MCNIQKEVIAYSVIDTIDVQLESIACLLENLSLRPY